MFMIKMCSKPSKSGSYRSLFVLVDNRSRFIQAWENKKGIDPIPEKFFPLVEKAFSIEVDTYTMGSTIRNFLERDYLDVTPDYTSKKRFFNFTVRYADPEDNLSMYVLMNEGGFIEKIYHNFEDFSSDYNDRYSEVIKVGVTENFFNWVINEYGTILSHYGEGGNSCQK